jgi:hypothetical protein
MKENPAPCRVQPTNHVVKTTRRPKDNNAAKVRFWIVHNLLFFPSKSHTHTPTHPHTRTHTHPPIHTQTHTHPAFDNNAITESKESKKSKPTKRAYLATRIAKTAIHSRCGFGCQYKPQRQLTATQVGVREKGMREREREKRKKEEMKEKTKHSKTRTQVCRSR